MSEKILDDFDLYSDLLMSIGTHDPDRPFTPIEVSDLIVRLKEETGDSWEELSKRLGLGKKKKSSTIKKSNDTTQLRLFEKLQNLSRRNAYSLGWGKFKDGKIAMTLGCEIAKLSDKDEQDILISAIIETSDTEKPIIKNDVKNILNRKIKSPEIPISEIIEHVSNTKPHMELFWRVGITPDGEFLEKFKEKISTNGLNPADFLKKLIQNKFKNNDIKSINISKNDLIWITLEEQKFKEMEHNWISKKIPVTSFFNQLLMEEIEHE